MNNMLLRAITGAIFVLLIVGCTLAHPLAFFLVFVIAAGLTTWEFSTNVNAHGGAAVNRLINTTAAVCLVAAMGGYCSGYTAARDFLPYLVTLLYLIISELYRREPNPLSNWAYALASHLYIALPFSMLYMLAFRYDPLEDRVAYEWIYPLSVFIFLWTSDTGAYLCGSLLHKRFPAKLFPRVSPAKSWVGSIGGGVLCLVVGVMLWNFFPDKMTLPQWLGLALVVCVFGTWGDLVESLLKRQLGVKDSGNFLPGHGGMLDRFDSSLLAIPAVVIYSFFIGM